MKHSLSINVESVSVSKVTLKGIHVDATAEYEADEMRAEGDVFDQVITTLCDKFGWLKPLVQKRIEIDIDKAEMLAESLRKQIEEGKCEAYGPNGWSVKHDTVTTTEDYDPEKDYHATTTIKKK